MILAILCFVGAFALFTGLMGWSSPCHGFLRDCLDAAVCFGAIVLTFLAIYFAVTELGSGSKSKPPTELEAK